MLSLIWCKLLMQSPQFTSVLSIMNFDYMKQVIWYTVYRVIFAHVIFALFQLQMVSPRLDFAQTKHKLLFSKIIFFYYLALKFGYFFIQLYRYTELFFLRRSMKSKNGSGHPALLNECYKLILKKNDNKLILIRAFSPAVALFSWGTLGRDV